MVPSCGLLGVVVCVVGARWLLMFGVFGLFGWFVMLCGGVVCCVWFGVALLWCVCIVCCVGCVVLFWFIVLFVFVFALYVLGLVWRCVL